MNITAKYYDQLTKDELYSILQLRSEVFVVEQDCVYQDIDGKDDKALHVMGFDGALLVAYTRCFPAGIYFEEAAIGRVVVRDASRKFGYGREIMEASIDEINKRFGNQSIRVSAQTYLDKFYRDLGFIPEGEGYLEDGIPHMSMVLKNTPH